MRHSKRLDWHRYAGGFWFRIFGHGLSFMDRRTYPAPFSVRVGARSELRIGHWGVKVIKP